MDDDGSEFDDSYMMTADTLLVFLDEVIKSIQIIKWMWITRHTLLSLCPLKLSALSTFSY